MKTNLLTKTLLVIGITAVTITAVLLLATLQAERKRVEGRALNRLHQIVESSGVMASVACFAHDKVLAQETAQALTIHPEVLKVAIWSGKDILAQAAASNNTDTENNPRNPTPFSRPVYSPFDASDKIGEIVIEPNWRIIREETEQEVQLAASLLLLTACLLFLAIASVLTWQVIRPVKAMSDELHRLDPAAGGILGVPAGHAGNELGRLAIDVNELLARFRNSLERQHEIRLQAVVHERLKLSATVFDHSSEGIIVTDASNLIITVNPAFTRITGYTEDEVIGKHPVIFASDHHEHDFYDHVWHILQDLGYWQGEMWNRCKDGRVIPERFAINAIRDSSGHITNYVAIFADITERKRAEERIEFLAHHDVLTKLPNRLLLRDRFTMARASAQRDRQSIAMMFLDLDHFKNVNDSLGHAVGDDLLIEVVARLQQTTRATDTICRQGGDEFIIVLPQIQSHGAVSQIAQNVLDVVRQPIDVGGSNVSVSASIGISMYPDDGDDFDTLLRNADAAMYDVKASGRNSYRFFTERMNADALSRLKLLAALRHAVAKDELFLLYQPQLDLLKNEVVGVEALIRWRRPEMGVIAPAQFIPAAEESGLISEIGDWVIASACRQCREWSETLESPIVVAINVSAVQFNRGTVVESVKRALAANNLDPGLLELEITESTLLHDLDKAMDTIQQLKALGVRLSIDDFGTGYSSLSYLKKIHVDKLKIDRSFVRDLESDPDDLAIVTAVIQLGQTLQLRIIAEGVETTEQLNILSKIGCHEAQGYYCGYPAPPETLKKSFASRSHPSLCT